MIIFTLTSCSLIHGVEKQNPENEQMIKESYKNGTYTEEGDIWKYGNENATVIISNGRITSITLRRLDNIGKEVNYDEWTGKKVNINVKPNLKKYRIDLAQKMLEKQTYDVEAISGATISSENWKRSVHRALNKAGK